MSNTESDSDRVDDSWVTAEDCQNNTQAKVLLGLVLLSSSIIIVASILGIRFYCKNHFLHGFVVGCLILSIIVIILEVFVYRFESDKDIRFRYINNTLSMWLVVMTFNFMLTFVRRNKAAHFKFDYWTYLGPLHFLYFVMLLIGYFEKEDGAFCTNE